MCFYIFLYVCTVLICLYLLNGINNLHETMQIPRNIKLKNPVAVSDSSHKGCKMKYSKARYNSNPVEKQVRNQNSRSRRRVSGRIGRLRSNEGSINFSSLSYLESLLSRNCDAILRILTKYEDEYSQVFNGNMDYESLRVITKITVKICESSFIADKYKILKITVCKTFIDAWKKQISHTSNLRLRDVDDILTIFENALDLMPSLSWYQIQTVLKLLHTMTIHNVNSSSQLNKLNKKVCYYENRYSRSNKRNSALAPEDDFHTISSLPSIKELVTRERNFVRSNVITGSYENVSHYLDILFRLQREDFLNPIREDICDHINGVNRHLFNIKIYNEVTFFGETCNKDDICYTLQIKMNKKLQERLNNKTQKNFMTGSLLLFTDDNFRTILKGLVANSVAIGRGEVTVSFEENFPILKRTYKMVECLVFFGPYYHVLNVLKTIDTDELPMGKYIVDVETSSSKRPAYLPLTVQKPTVNLNKSQEMAYNAALSKEFVIIQGPPGTGKTFLGLTITKELLNYSKGPILIICYTNHALDQFLEGLLPATENLVRLGSQSKNEKLQDKILGKMKSKLRITQMVAQEREIIEQSAATIKGIDKSITLLREHEGIVSLNYLQTVLRDSFTEEYLFVWLLQDTTKYNGDMETEFLREIYWNYVRSSKSKPGYLISPFDMENWLEFISTSISNLKMEIKSANAAFIGGEIPKEEYSYYLLSYESELKFLNDDYEFIKDKINFLTEQLHENHNSSKSQKMKDPSTLSTKARWQLYRQWLEETEEILEAEKKKQLIQYRAAYADFNVSREDADVATLKKMDIIGITTSCAARMHSTLERVACPIVIVEEAAEVLEAHIVTALSKDCQHLILLGDHQQLKPGTADYVIGNQFDLGISLFERMVKNNIQCHTLNVQHRMRPEIASLITPVIYPNLINSASVNKYPVVRGVKNSLFFIHHENPEEEFGDSSKLNKFEAEYLVKLADYLLKVGYGPEEITVLAAYAGQVVTINNIVANIKNKDLNKVCVTTVDNFQGEENRIILLSLVRNNDEGNVGFLRIENRICVALSRAKEGFYVMGNLKMLSKASDIWKDIKNTLKNHDSKGRSLPLLCENHQTVTKIREIEDFEKVPEGGCDKDCMYKLDCGHECQRKCHLDDLKHKNYKCRGPCRKEICDIPSHDLCKKYCYENCGECTNSVTVTLKCGHDQNVLCYESERLDKVQCLFQENILLTCGHDYNKICHQRHLLIQCEKVCNKLLTCGHKCAQKCHYRIDPDHIDYKCAVKCEKNNMDCKKFGKKHFSSLSCYQEPILCNEKSTKVRKECSHFFNNIQCHKDVNKMNCTKPCKKNLPCGHLCRNNCSDICGPCKFEMPQQAECGHWINTICGSIQSVITCTQPCDKNLECGHSCPNKCNQRCATKCQLLCSKELDCGHICTAFCGQPCFCSVCSVDSLRLESLLRIYDESD